VEAILMTFKIERVVDGKNTVILRVCRRMAIDCVNTLKRPVARTRSPADSGHADGLIDITEVRFER
jgi:hypothetical protein